MNPNIPLSFQRPRFDPSQGQRNALAMQSADLQNAAAAMQLQEAQRQRGVRNSLAGIDTSTPEGMRQAANVYGQAGELDQSIKINTYLDSLDDKERTRELGEIDSFVKVAPLLMNEGTYAQGLEMANQYAPSLAGRLPPQFSPDIAPAIEGMALGVKGALEQRNANRKAAETERHNRAVEANKGTFAGMGPANIQEWNAYQAMTPEEQRQYLIMKRANPYLNLGNEMVQPDPTQAGVAMGGFDKGVSPDADPKTKAAQATAVARAEAGVKRENAMHGTADLLKEAESILKSGKPTQSGVGAVVDKAGALVGATPEGAGEADQLSIIAGNLVSKVPRMEGPQSNYDVQNYKEMAGDLGNRSLPIKRRLKALDTLKLLNKKYEHLNKEQPVGGIRFLGFEQ